MFWQPATSPRLFNLHFCHLCHTVVHSRETKFVCLFLICFFLYLFLSVRERDRSTGKQEAKRHMLSVDEEKDVLTSFCTSAVACPTADWLSGEWVTGKWKKIDHGHQRGACPTGEWHLLNIHIVWIHFCFTLFPWY